MTTTTQLILAALAGMVDARQGGWWLAWRFFAEHPDLYGDHPTA